MNIMSKEDEKPTTILVITKPSRIGSILIAIALLSVPLLAFTSYSTYKLNRTIAPTINTDRTYKQLPVAIEKIQKEKKLITASAEWNNHDIYIQEAYKKFLDKWNIPLTKKSFEYPIEGKVEAQVDFEQLKTKKTGTSFVCTLPIPTTEVTINDARSGLTSRSENPLNSVSPEEVDDFRENCKASAESNAIQKGLIDKAKTEAEKIVKTEFSEVGITQNHVIVNWN